MGDFAVVLAAAGKSTRFGKAHTKKVFTMLGTKPVWMHAAEVFANRSDVKQIVLVISQEDKEYFNEKYSGNAAMLGVEVVLGGAERADSVLAGLQKVREGIDFVAIHDAARPCLADQWITSVFDRAKKTGAALLATPCAPTIKRVNPDRVIEETVPRAGLWLAQTPQVFRRQLLLEAYAKHSDPQSATDDASIVEESGHPVSVVEGNALNIKITTKSDLKFAELAVKALPKPNPFPF